MKLYLLKQHDNIGYDTFDKCIVCAENEEDAKSIDPSGEIYKEDKMYGDWAKKKSAISCMEIGTANEDLKRGVILASFLAG